MSAEYEHLVMRSVARYGRMNIGNFEPDLHETLSALIGSGLIAATFDAAHQDTVWCALTHAGYERLFDLNSLDQPVWSQVSWQQEAEPEAHS